MAENSSTIRQPEDGIETPRNRVGFFGQTSTNSIGDRIRNRCLSIEILTDGVFDQVILDGKGN